MKRNLKRLMALGLTSTMVLTTSVWATDHPTDDAPFDGYIIHGQLNSGAEVMLMGEEDLGISELPYGFYLVEELDMVLDFMDIATVMSIEKNYYMELFSESYSPDDPRYTNGAQYNLDMVGMDYAWANGLDGTGVTIGVVDTGLVYDHEDMDYSKITGYNAVDGTDYYHEERTTLHGTSVAGVIGATTNNGVGVAGVAPGANLVILKSFGADGVGGTIATIVAALDAGVEMGCDIINMSVGTYSVSTALKTAVENATAAGVIIVASAGNGNEGNYTDYCYPASYDQVISVSSVDSTATRASTSQYNDMVDITGPGVALPVIYKAPSTYATQSGTSFSAPMVTAILALALQVNATLTHDRIMELIEETATDIGTAGRDNLYGHGLINVETLIEALREEHYSVEMQSSGVMVSGASVATECDEVTPVQIMVTAYDAYDRPLAIELVEEETNDYGWVTSAQVLLDLAVMPTRIQWMVVHRDTWELLSEVKDIDC